MSFLVGRGGAFDKWSGKSSEVKELRTGVDGQVRVKQYEPEMNIDWWNDVVTITDDDGQIYKNGGGEVKIYQFTGQGATFSNTKDNPHVFSGTIGGHQLVIYHEYGSPGKGWRLGLPQDHCHSTKWGDGYRRVLSPGPASIRQIFPQALDIFQLHIQALADAWHADNEKVKLYRRNFKTLAPQDIRRVVNVEIAPDIPDAVGIAKAWAEWPGGECPPELIEAEKELALQGLKIQVPGLLPKSKRCRISPKRGGQRYTSNSDSLFGSAISSSA